MDYYCSVPPPPSLLLVDMSGMGMHVGSPFPTRFRFGEKTSPYGGGWRRGGFAQIGWVQSHSLHEKIPTSFKKNSKRESKIGVVKCFTNFFQNKYVFYYFSEFSTYETDFPPPLSYHVTWKKFDPSLCHGRPETYVMSSF
jgi:hypothetical protein